MKKFISLLLSVSLLVSCTAFDLFSVSAATASQTITLNRTISAYVNSASKEYRIKFEPSYTGFFEFVCSPNTNGGMILGTIVDASKEVLMMNSCVSGDADFITAAELTAGNVYYFVLETDGTAYSTPVTVRAHKHNFNTTESYPAVYNANDKNNSSDGGSFVLCAYCCEYTAKETYKYPSSVSLKSKKLTYNGKQRKNTVTVKDRSGKVIPASNYKVTYKNNVKPGTATVYITFNNKRYSGKMSKTFTIIPKKPTIKSVKSPKKEQIKVAWKKDSTVSGYQIQYSTSKKFEKSKSQTVTVNKKYTSKTISKLKANKKYYLRIRSYKTIKGKKIYGSWSSVKSVKTKK